MQAVEHAVGRSRPAAETVARMIPRLSEFGITRLARQTGLDRIGIPCFAAFRPNAWNLSSSQGKGVDDAAAMASAIMEAVEFSVAEAPQCMTISGTPQQLVAGGLLPASIDYLMPPGTEPKAGPSTWFLGYGLSSNRPICVPADAVRINGSAKEYPGICQTTNGLASGNTPEEAILHALCELVERDASTLWSLKSPETQLGTAVNCSTLKDPDLLQLCSMVADSGLDLRLFDQTTDIGIPCMMAVIGGRGGSARKFAFSAGYGAHPVAKVAAFRAITEAAQTRITSIASSRDDLGAKEFSEQIDPTVMALLETRPHAVMPHDFCAPAEAHVMMVEMAHALLRRGINDPVVVPISAPDEDFTVVRVFCPELEDAGANANWRPRQRAQAAAG